MKNRSYHKTLSVPDMLARIVEAAKAGDVEGAKSMSDLVAVQTAKTKAFGRTAVTDGAYDARSPATRAPFENKKDIEVGASCLTHCNDEDYGPPTSDEHKLTTWFAAEMSEGLARGLPPTVIGRRCAARVLDKNASRYSKFRHDAVAGINELLLRLDPNTTDLLAMNETYEPVQMPSDAADQADASPVATDSQDMAPCEPVPTNASGGEANREAQTETDPATDTETEIASAGATDGDPLEEARQGQRDEDQTP